MSLAELHPSVGMRIVLRKGSAAPPSRGDLGASLASAPAEASEVAARRKGGAGSGLGSGSARRDTVRLDVLVSALEAASRSVQLLPGVGSGSGSPPSPRGDGGDSGVGATARAPAASATPTANGSSGRKRSAPVLQSALVSSEGAAAPAAADRFVRGRGKPPGGRLSGTTLTSSASGEPRQLGGAAARSGLGSGHARYVGGAPQASAKSGAVDARTAQQARWQALSSLAAASAKTQAAGATLAGAGQTRQCNSREPDADLRSASDPHLVRLQLHAPDLAVLRCTSAPSASLCPIATPSQPVGEHRNKPTVVPESVVRTRGRGMAEVALPTLPAAPVESAVTGTHGTRSLALSPFAAPEEAAGVSASPEGQGQGKADLQRAIGSGSSDSDTSGSDTEKRFVAAVEIGVPRPRKKRRLDAVSALRGGLASAGEASHASSSVALDAETLGAIAQITPASTEAVVLRDELRSASGLAGASDGGRASLGSGAGLGTPLASEPGPLKSFGSVQALCPEVRVPPPPRRLGHRWARPP